MNLDTASDCSASVVALQQCTCLWILTESDMVFFTLKPRFLQFMAKREEIIKEEGKTHQPVPQ